ncbi:MAG: FAD-dependent oxidoreductase [Rhizomicrobium sp.]|jgi:2-polyprenyl-6-methoxyphenol hydroxylase-like FAD-dependent oxidoreductase
MNTDRESILVAGAGIAGLGAALALSNGCRTVTILDRDPAPPDSSPDNAFYDWERRGATQLRHSHAFIGRLTTLIRRRYPDLMDELLEAGARLFSYEEALPPALKARYVRQDADDELAFIFSRRTTLELILRRYAARLPGVSFLANASVRGLIAERDGNAILVKGLDVECDGTTETLHADVVVDASGRNTVFPDWLRAQGAVIDEEQSPAGILYYTRHYRLRDGQDEPPRDGTPGGGDLGYIKFGIFVADNRHFSVTLATPEIEAEMRKVVVRPDVFDTICRQIPACARWIDPLRAEPVSQVFSMGNLVSVWRHFVKDGKPQVLNFFAIGDAAMRTNPLYGRGCSAGVAHAHMLHDVLASASDPRERAVNFERVTFDSIRPFYDTMVKQDLQAIRRAEHELDPAHKPSLKARLAKSFVEDALIPATRGDIAVSRASSRAFHMIGHPTRWLTRPVIAARILRMWMMPRSAKLARDYYPPSFGPARNEMLARLGLPA